MEMNSTKQTVEIDVPFGWDVIAYRQARAGEDYVNCQGNVQTADCRSASAYPILVRNYAGKQADWVRRNNIKVGDEVRVSRGWAEREGGADVGLFAHPGALSSCTVNGICTNAIRIGAMHAPYFALEKVQPPKFRPFRDRAEFLPFSDLFVYDVSHPKSWLRVTEIEDDRIHAGGTVYLFEAAVDYLKFAETGKPVGVQETEEN